MNMKSALSRSFGLVSTCLVLCMVATGADPVVLDWPPSSSVPALSIDGGTIGQPGGTWFKVRRGAATNIAALTLGQGVLAYDTDNDLLKVGDGSTAGGVAVGTGAGGGGTVLTNLPTGAMFVAGILRNTGSGWYAIDDGTHVPINIASITNDTAKITVTLSDSHTKILWAMSAMDETYSGAGVWGGPSVGIGYIEIYLYQMRMNHAYIYYDGANWQIANSSGVTSVSWASNKLTVNHGQFDSLGGSHAPQVTMRGLGCLAACDAVGSALSEVIFCDFTGAQITTESTDMKFFFSAVGGGVLDPTDVVNGLANIWLAAIVAP